MLAERPVLLEVLQELRFSPLYITDAFEDLAELASPPVGVYSVMGFGHGGAPDPNDPNAYVPQVRLAALRTQGAGLVEFWRRVMRDTGTFFYPDVVGRWALYSGALEQYTPRALDIRTPWGRPMS